MKFIQRRVFCLLGTIILLTSVSPALYAQASPAGTADEKLQQERQIAWNIFRLAGSIGNHFKDFKGDSIGTENGITGYHVKGLLNMHADNEFIMVKANGTAYYVATITGDELRLNLYFLAFNYGIDDFTAEDKIPLVAKPDPGLSNDEKDVYVLMLNDIKVGSLTREKNNMRETLIIGFVK